MKKIMTLAMSVVAITFASCGGSTNAGGATDSIATDTTVETEAEVNAEELTNKVIESVKSGDVETIKATLTEAQEEVEELLENGDIEGAKAYASKVKALYEENKQKIEEIAAGSTTLTELFNTDTSIPTEVTDVTEAAGEAVKAYAKHLGKSAEVFYIGGTASLFPFGYILRTEKQLFRKLLLGKSEPFSVVFYVICKSFGYKQCCALLSVSLFFIYFNTHRLRCQ